MKREQGAGSRNTSYDISSMIPTKNLEKGAGSRTTSYELNSMIPTKKCENQEQGSGLFHMIIIP